MKKNWKNSVAIAVICAMLSFSLTWQMRSIWARDQAQRAETTKTAQLQTQLAAEQKKNEALYKQILQYKDDLQTYSDQAQASGGYAKGLAQQLERSMILSGQSTVKGQGVKVVLQDSQQENTTGASEASYVIHDEDLLKVINELRDAGAEALSLNGERLLSTSEIRCAGSIVSVNNNRYTAPFTIRAIGNADELSNALTMRDGVVDSLAVWGIDCEITKVQSMTIAGYSGAVDFQYAKPVTTTAKTSTATEGGDR